MLLAPPFVRGGQGRLHLRRRSISFVAGLVKELATCSLEDMNQTSRALSAIFSQENKIEFIVCCVLSV